VARQGALTATQSAIVAALTAGGAPPGGSSPGDIALAQSFVNDVATYRTDLATLDADQASRFPASHQQGIDVENEYNSERGYAARP